jgi:3-phosphoshikimate 1-carboxyvinyltransferase
VIRPAKLLCGKVRVPGDKSISHRAVMLGGLASGASHIQGFLPSGDCLATVACMRALGIHVEQLDPTSTTGQMLLVFGQGLYGLRPPQEALDCARSGTSMRLLAGILAGQNFSGPGSEFVLTGAPQLCRRPMRRITSPLRQMGAQIEDVGGCAPLTIRGRRLRGVEHKLTVASAQVKSALLLAGLYADGPTTVRQCGPARDHSERMLAAMGAEIKVHGLDVTLAPPASLSPLRLTVPGDLSSAAFLLVAALLLPGSELTLEGVGVNPTRTGLLDVLHAMGVGAGGSAIEVLDERQEGGEPTANLVVRSAPTGGGALCGATVQGDAVVRMIDEFPILAVAATQAQGRTIVRDAAELRVKETDRIAAVVDELTKMGAQIEGYADGFCVTGPTPLHGATVDSHSDHRLGMALAVAGLVAEGETVVQNAGCIGDSFPGFAEILDSLRS